MTPDSPIPTITLDFLRSIPLRSWNSDASKADYGKLLIVGGSRRLAGAVLLSARAALRTGCGTVRVAVPESVAVPLMAACPELMIIPLPETPEGTIALSALQVLEAQWKPCDVAVIGPGLDEHEETSQMAREFVQNCPLPCVVDASAIEAASTCRLTEETARVFTPHDGEAKGLIENYEIENREQMAQEWASEKGATLALKGRETIIASPDGRAARNVSGTRGMGTAGSGDVLTGVIGALLAQGHDAFTAATYGVHLHALAGERASQVLGDDGMMASDFGERIPFVLREMRRELRRYRP
jgi:hydroxyethylthiazole kinase-like uncharacterized protein yjeF